MLRCSPEAFAKCPTRHICGNIQEATFMEGSECDLFNRSIASKPMTNGDRIRAMSDEELTELLWDAYNAGSDDAEAWHFGDGHRHSFEWDLEWLQQPAEEET